MKNKFLSDLKSLAANVAERLYAPMTLGMFTTKDSMLSEAFKQREEAHTTIRKLLSALPNDIAENGYSRGVYTVFDGEALRQLMTNGLKMQPLSWVEDNERRQSYFYIEEGSSLLDTRTLNTADNHLQTSTMGCKIAVDTWGPLWVKYHPIPAVVEKESLASQRPWTYHNTTSQVSAHSRDWIEDANGIVVVENVGRIDGPLICAAVNTRHEESFANEQNTKGR